MWWAKCHQMLIVTDFFKLTNSLPLNFKSKNTAGKFLIFLVMDLFVFHLIVSVICVSIWKLRKCEKNRYYCKLINQKQYWYIFIEYLCISIWIVSPSAFHINKICNLTKYKFSCNFFYNLNSILKYHFKIFCSVNFDQIPY